jgi:hypothetical protein
MTREELEKEVEILKERVRELESSLQDSQEKFISLEKAHYALADNVYNYLD